MTDPRVTIAIASGIADVRLNRPDKMNAIDPAMFDALVDSIDRLSAEPGLRAVVLSGEGRAFCAGLDMASMSGNMGAIDIATRTHGAANRVQQVAWGWRMLDVPVIAAVHGIVFGGGLQIASGADMVIAHPAARLSVMEVKWGLVPDMAGFALWRGRVRDDRLRDLAYTAREFDGAEAVTLGFALRTADDPLAEARALAEAIAARSPNAIRAAKRLANLAVDADAATILHHESDAQAALVMQPNQVEAVRANLEKRAPRFIE